MKGISMLKIKEILRLKCEAKLSNRKIARALNISHSVVNTYVKALEDSQRPYREIILLSDKEILSLFTSMRPKKQKYPWPDFAKVHIELRNPIVTLTLLHEEYIERCPKKQGYGFTWFTQHYRAYAKKVNPSMHLVHKAGEKIFIDFSGKTVDIADPFRGTVSKAELFIAVLPASGFAFVKAIASQKKRDFLDAHVAMFEYFGGVSELLVPDNLKSAVTKTDNYDPDLNVEYATMARHYGCAVMPARVKKPKDKAHVELSVKLVQRWILARLRHFTFYSIEELNLHIQKLLPFYLDKVMKLLGVSRRELFHKLDKPALLPLPSHPYEYKAFKLLKVSKDYHVQLEHNFYSVPYQLIGKKVEVWFSATVVSITYEGKIVATHPKLFHRGHYSTHKAHMASAHQKYLEWSPGKIMNWGLTVGKESAKLFRIIMESRPHPEMGFRTCLGVIREYTKYMEKGYSQEHLEIISALAISKHLYKVAQVKYLLKSHYPKEHDESASLIALRGHENIRGAEYFS